MIEIVLQMIVILSGVLLFNFLVRRSLNRDMDEMGDLNRLYNLDEEQHSS